MSGYKCLIFLTTVILLFAIAVTSAFSQGAVITDPALPTQNKTDESSLVLAEPTNTVAQTENSSVLPYIFRMLLVLAIILAVIYVLYVLLKRASKPAIEEDTYLKLLASTSLGQGKRLHVVSLGNKAWLLGSSDSFVGLISEINDKEIIDTLELRAAQSPQTPTKDFASSLLNSLGISARKAKKDKVSHDFLSHQRDRLKKL